MEKHITLALLDFLTTSEKLHLASLCHDGEDVLRHLGVGGTLRSKLLYLKDACLRWMEEPGNHIALLDYDGYPPLLKEIDNPPFLLMFQGSLSHVGPLITMVGSGKPSHDARLAVHSLVSECVDLGLAVVSGLSLGLQRSVVESMVSSTCGTLVVSDGDLVVDPPERNSLVEMILDLGGAILSEFPPHKRSKAWHIPMWTRILSGLSPVTVVVESPLRSEAMMVADFALDQGRDVVVLGGWESGPMGVGASSLVRDGATVVHSLQDITGHCWIGCPKGVCRRVSENPWSYTPGLYVDRWL